ncbi:hypothetical protein HK105_207665 [Polyrhizophydium stewartii]|uniref:Ribonucleases P/MRP subunit Pop8-like domain-containing protein n=1 Tax=Polyrhizophydium stewartii TaxID=2732419 RepID=A0ABR4N076_9FUNG|nr:hypothetical protein HK105_002525 [Polyrhizophydium stewartii]
MKRPRHHDADGAAAGTGLDAGAAVLPPETEPSAPARHATTHIAVTAHPWCYMHLRVEFARAEGAPADFDETHLKNAVVSALRKAFGIVGAAVPVDVLHKAGAEGFIRTPFEDAPVVASALALCSDYNGMSCRISVVKSSPFLVSLA